MYIRFICGIWTTIQYSETISFINISLINLIRECLLNIQAKPHIFKLHQIWTFSSQTELLPHVEGTFYYFQLNFS